MLCLFKRYIKTAESMEIITHLINDTVEFYKWSLTIAGDHLESSQCFNSVTLCFHFGECVN